jgi:bifunctional non-homologous end joining protein LigD
MGLDAYRKKRVFTETTEPRASLKLRRARKGPLLFVVQKHDASHLHYDFRLELDGVLKSWAVPKGPSMNPKDKRLAMMVEDHPISYADFEGEIPKGHYGAGDVIVWDRGVYSSAESADPEKSRRVLKSGLHKGEIKIVLFGEKLKGGFALVKLKNDDNPSGRRAGNSWLLIKDKDQYAKEIDVTKKTSSVITGKKLPRDLNARIKK